MNLHGRTFLRNLILSLAAACSLYAAAAEPQELIPRPTPPDTLLNLQPRCDFIVTRFWDRCNLEQVVLHPDELRAAFGEWVGIMPHASADSVHAAIDKLLSRSSKSGPITLRLAELAEYWAYTDSADYFSEEIYLPFAKAAANHKKINKLDRARFAHDTQIIESSGINATVPDLKFTRRDGSQGSMADAANASVLLFINDPECFDCNMARIRLANDYNTKQLIESGELIIVSIYPGAPDEKAWRDALPDYPENWIVGAMPDADKYFLIDNPPTFIFLNRDHRVLAKDLPVDHYLNAFQVANTRASQKAAQQ